MLKFFSQSNHNNLLVWSEEHGLIVRIWVVRVALFADSNMVQEAMTICRIVWMWRRFGIVKAKVVCFRFLHKVCQVDCSRAAGARFSWTSRGHAACRQSCLLLPIIDWALISIIANVWWLESGNVSLKCGSKVDRQSCWDRHNNKVFFLKP